MIPTESVYLNAIFRATLTGNRRRISERIQSNLTVFLFPEGTLITFINSFNSRKIYFSLSLVSTISFCGSFCTIRERWRSTPLANQLSPAINWNYRSGDCITRPWSSHGTATVVRVQGFSPAKRYRRICHATRCIIAKCSVIDLVT